jgi:xylose dehydrogenase (NAD/NADP)
MSVSQSINVGIVGLGWPGERHAEALNASPLGSVYAACDQNAERLKAFADSFGPKQSFASFDEMLLDSELNAVVIGLPNALHYPFSLRALQAGKHVLCEKPPTMNAEQNCGRFTRKPSTEDWSTILAVKSAFRRPCRRRRK